MAQKLILGWALGATLVAVGSLGYILGKQTGGADSRSAMLPTEATEATEEGDRAGPAAPVYRVPEALQDIPDQWRSVVEGKPSGYSVLFEPHSRRMIAEQCKHLGYDTKNLTGPLGMPCEVLVRGQLASLLETEAMLLDRSGQPSTVGIDLDVQGETPVLRLRIDGREIKLVPGSRNDLLQDMEALRQIQEQKQSYLEAMGRPAAKQAQ